VSNENVAASADRDHRQRECYKWLRQLGETMLICPLCECRVATGDDAEWCSGDCQCSRETMARKIISMESVVRQSRLDREHFCAASERVREPLAARVRWLERKLVEVAEITEDLSSLPCTWNGKADSCPMCSGECCNYCGAGCWSNEHNCQHDSLTRHAEPPNVTDHRADAQGESHDQ
jgi:hypothetical protein